MVMSPTLELKVLPLLVTFKVLPVASMFTFSEPAVTPHIVPFPPEDVKVMLVAYPEGS